MSFASRIKTPFVSALLTVLFFGSLSFFFVWNFVRLANKSPKVTTLPAETSWITIHYSGPSIATITGNKSRKVQDISSLEVGHTVFVDVNSYPLEVKRVPGGYDFSIPRNFEKNDSYSISISTTKEELPVNSGYTNVVITGAGGKQTGVTYETGPITEKDTPVTATATAVK